MAFTYRPGMMAERSKTADAYALRELGGNTPDTWEDDFDERVEEEVGEQVEERTAQAPTSALQAGGGWEIRAPDLEKAEPTPDRQVTGLPTSKAPFRRSRTADWNHYRQKYLRYSGATTPEQIAAADKEIARYKMGKFRERWGEGLARLQQGDGEGGARLIEEAYDYFTNGQSMTAKFDPGSGGVLVQPYHEKTGQGGKPKLLDMATLQDVPRQLTMASFGYYDPQMEHQAGVETRAQRMEPLKQEQTRARTALTGAQTARQQGLERRGNEAWGYERAGLERNEQDIQRFRNQMQQHSDVMGIVDKYVQGTPFSRDFVAAVIAAESGFNPGAVSPKGAQGLMQLIPATAKRFDVTDPMNPEQNIRGGIKYLTWLYNRFGGDFDKVLAGYNAGENAVDKHGGTPPFPETQGYVRKIRNLVGNTPGPEDFRREYAMGHPERWAEYEKSQADLQKSALQQQGERMDLEQRQKYMQKLSQAIEDGNTEEALQIAEQHLLMTDPAKAVDVYYRLQRAATKAAMGKPMRMEDKDGIHETFTDLYAKPNNWAALTATDQDEWDQVFGGGEQQTEQNIRDLAGISTEMLAETWERGVHVPPSEIPPLLGALLTGKTGIDTNQRTGDRFVRRQGLDNRPVYLNQTTMRMLEAIRARSSGGNTSALAGAQPLWTAAGSGGRSAVQSTGALAEQAAVGARERAARAMSPRMDRAFPVSDERPLTGGF